MNLSNTRTQQPLQVWIHASPDLGGRSRSHSKQQGWFRAFNAKLKQAKSLGVDGIILPVSWRHIEPFSPGSADEAESWQFYRPVIETIIKHRLKVIPDFALAATGLSQASRLNLLPDWLWGELLNERPDDCLPSDIKYRGPEGLDSFTAVSLWRDDLAMPHYQRFIAGFCSNFADLAEHIPQIILGPGVEGELRYPLLGHYRSEGNHAQLSCFTPSARADFKQAMLEHYGSLTDWQKDWSEYGLRPSDDELFEQIHEQLERHEQNPPLEQFCKWFSESLMHHGARIFNMVDQVFVDQWQHCQIGMRLPVTLPHELRKLTMHPNANEIISGLNPAPLADDEQQLAQFRANLSLLMDGPWRKRSFLLMGGLDELSSNQEISLLQQAATELELPMFAENRDDKNLEAHYQWDHLLKTVMEQPGFRGWSLRDLDMLGHNQGIGVSRLRQIGRLKNGQGLVSTGHRKSFRVMGPLHLKVSNQKQLLDEENWQEFDRELKILRDSGVSAVSTDLWWGLIEGRQPGQFDWSYYDRFLELLAENQMHWVPILSFHQAGGNVNDDFNQTIPLWLWGQLMSENDEIQSVRDLQYVSETGDTSMEYVSHWADAYVLPYYMRFIAAFQEHYRPWAGIIDEINISMGPAGELRYPSYNAHDWGNYPNRGTLQCYSPLAEQDWRSYLRQKFRHINGVNSTFGTHYKSFDEIQVPEADGLFKKKNYIYSSWAREFFTWYNGALAKHGNRILTAVLEQLDDQDFKNVPIGIKIPGIHWEISDPDLPRAAEISAGLICPHASLGPTNNDEYLHLLRQIVPEQYKSRVVVHFTCLEMVNKDHEGYSRAKDLVYWMADAAHQVGVQLMGENALAGELYGQQGWDQIEQALVRNPGYDGVTLLRMQNFFDGSDLPLKSLRSLVNRVM